MVRRVLFRLRQVPSWVWGTLAMLAVLGIPDTVHALALPDEPIFAEVRADALREIVVQCVASSLLLAICVCRRQSEAHAKQHTGNGPQDDMRNSCLQFGIADILVWTTGVAVSLSSWALSGSWLVLLLVGTCVFQACALRHHPSRLKIGAAWAAVWMVVGVMVVTRVG